MEEKLTTSQTSLCEILQEKGRWVGVSLDQSALLPLRFKNIREKTDAHFVDVIKEDRYSWTCTSWDLAFGVILSLPFCFGVLTSGAQVNLLTALHCHFWWAQRTIL